MNVLTTSLRVLWKNWNFWYVGDTTMSLLASVKISGILHNKSRFLTHILAPCSLSTQVAHLGLMSWLMQSFRTGDTRSMALSFPSVYGKWERMRKTTFAIFYWHILLARTQSCDSNLLEGRLENVIQLCSRRKIKCSLVKLAL